MAERLVTLVRHGRHDRTSTDPSGGDLLEMGCEQAEYAADAIRQGLPVTAIHSSTMRRARSTAQVISSRIPWAIYNEDKMLVEAVFHVPQHSQDVFNQLYDDVTPSTVANHRVRMAYAYKHYMCPPDSDEDQHDVLVCHGNVIRYFIVRAMHAPLRLWTQMEIYHASITRLLVDEAGKIRLVTHNEVSHLPRALWTTS